MDKILEEALRRFLIRSLQEELVYKTLQLEELSRKGQGDEVISKQIAQMQSELEELGVIRLHREAELVLESVNDLLSPKECRVPSAFEILWAYQCVLHDKVSAIYFKHEEKKIAIRVAESEEMEIIIVYRVAGEEVIVTCSLVESWEKVKHLSALCSQILFVGTRASYNRYMEDKKA